MHRKMIEILQREHRQLENVIMDESCALDIQLLVKVFKAHIADEEHSMRRTHYTELHDHMKEHNRIITTLYTLPGSLIEYELRVLVVGVLTKHIATFDHPFLQHLQDIIDQGYSRKEIS